MSLMAMIFFIFASVNAMTYYAMTTIQTFLAIVFRLSSVFDMEEYTSQRKAENVKPEDVQVTFENANFTWGF